jgi:hypothetical protein
MSVEVLKVLGGLVAGLIYLIYLVCKAVYYLATLLILYAFLRVLWRGPWLILVVGALTTPLVYLLFCFWDDDRR